MNTHTLLCNGARTPTLLCTSPLCQHHPLLCTHTHCTCHTHLLTCEQLKPITKLINTLQSNSELANIHQLKNYFNLAYTAYESLIKKLEIQKQELLDRFRKHLMTEPETKILLHIQNNTLHELPVDQLKEIARTTQEIKKQAFSHFTHSKQWLRSVETSIEEMLKKVEAMLSLKHIQQFEDIRNIDEDQLLRTMRQSCRAFAIKDNHLINNPLESDLDHMTAIRFKEFAAGDFEKIVRRLPNLQIVSLTGCGVVDRDLSVILEAAKKIGKLKVLHLNGNEVGDEGAIEVADFVRRKRIEVDLSGNRVSEIMKQSIREAFKEMDLWL